LNPIIPFEPVYSKTAPEGREWVAQVKWDGVRVLTYYDGRTVRLFNRKRNERTMHYPELQEVQQFCTASSVILDGEIIALDKGKPSFHEVMRRDGIRKPENVEKARNQTPIIYMVFDVLFYNGNWSTGLALKERQEILSSILRPQENIQLVENFPDGNNLFQAIKAQGMEGIVCKDLNRPYLINGKDHRWQKVKNYRDLIAVIGGFTLRGGIINAVLLGLYDGEGKFWYIGHTGTGKIGQTEWKALTEVLHPLIRSKRPFSNVPERQTGAFWVEPKITVKVQYMEWTEGRSLRQPSIQGFVAVPPEQCIMSLEMFH